jgi:hypothetical protein
MRPMVSRTLRMQIILGKNLDFGCFLLSKMITIAPINAKINSGKGINKPG